MSCAGSPCRSTRRWRSARSSPGPCGPAGRRCCSSGRPAARCRWRSTCSAPSGGWRWRSASTTLDEIGDRIGALVKPELPVGWSGIREGLGKVLQLKSRAAEEGEDRALPGGRAQGRRGRPEPAARPAGLARRRRHLPQLRADPHQAPGDRQAQPRASTGCSSTRTTRSACTGRSTRTPPRTTRSPSGAASGCRSPIAFGCDPVVSATRPARRCPATSTSTCSPASCAASGSRWSTA